jgi:hypothetical protein
MAFIGQTRTVGGVDYIFTEEGWVKVGGGGGGGGGAGPQVGDVRWITNSVGLLEEQEWIGSRWLATGQVRNPLPGEDGGGGTPRTQFESERALDIAQAERLRQQTELERQNFQAAIDAATAQFEQDQILLGQKHDNALAILEQELVNATGLQAEQIQANIDLENLRHENDLAELRLTFENQMKTQLIGEIGAERRTLIQEKGRAQERQVERAGRDPVRHAFNIRGQQAPSATPEDIFKREQMAFINQPLPNVNLNAPLSQLQSAFSQLQNIQPPAGGFLGLPSLAHGGVIEMARGSDGAFSRVPVIVGDEGPELALLSPGDEVIPLSKLPGLDLTRIPRAQGGLRVQPGGTGPDQNVPSPIAQEGIVAGAGTAHGLNLSAIYQALLGRSTFFGSQIRQAFDVPTNFLRDIGFDQFSKIVRGEIPAKFGSQLREGLPRLNELIAATAPSGGGVPPPPAPPAFSPEALQSVLGLANLPFLQSARLSLGLPGTGPLGPGAFSQLGVLAPGAPSPAITGRLPAFQALREPLTLERALLEMGVPTSQAQQISGQFGPFAAPFKQASGIPSLSPTERGLFNSLYGLLGFTPEDINAQVRAATIKGSGFRGTGVG